MDYYNQLLTIVHENLGKPVANILSLETEQAYYVSHAVIFLSVAFVLMQIIGFFAGSSTYSPSAPSSSTKK
jgi:hypothetical protein